MVRTWVVLLFTSLCLSVPLPLVLAKWVDAQAQQTPVNPLAESLAAYKKRVDEYMKLRNDITKKIPEVKETGDPAKIHSREKALGEAIAAARTTAKPGDVFEPAVPYFKQTVNADWKSRSVADRKALFSELPKGVQLGINRPYPTTLPLVTVPAKLLAQLPPMPEALEYRLIDRYLLLRDRDANLIIDLIPGVLPQKIG